MAEPLFFDSREEFLDALGRLISEGLPRERIRVFTPFAVPEAEAALRARPSGVGIFALVGALSGTIAGFALTILTSVDWPTLIVGGKPIVSIPPFIIIAFELTILLGGLFAVLGFLLLSRRPSLRLIRSTEEYGNRFVILVEEERRS